jgi:hypothetical protein
MMDDLKIPTDDGWPEKKAGRAFQAEHRMEDEEFLRRR